MIRMSPDEYKEYQNQLNARMRARLDIAATMNPGEVREKVSRARRGTRNKYGAEATMIDGMRFDSKAEAKRYQQLVIMQRAGEISDLETQVAFDLIPEQNVNGRKERPVRYLADFRYIRDGKTITEDVKSAPTKTAEFIIKRKLMLWIHGVIIQEVLMS
jgi:hypothetical protein